jgi:hypothetical protein
MKMKDLIVVESAYEDGINDGKRGHRNPRASSIYGPSSDHYEKGYQHGVVLGKKEGEKNARRYDEWLKPFLHLSNKELHDLAEKFRTSPEDRMSNGQPYPYNSKFQAIHQVLGHRKHNPNYGLDSKQDIAEKWSQKYKSSINCSHPKGFSQRAHCAGKKKHNESHEVMEMVCPDCGMCQTHGNLNEIKKGQKDSNGFTKCWPGHHAAGTKKGKNGGQVRNCVPNEEYTNAGGPRGFTGPTGAGAYGMPTKSLGVKESATAGATSSANIASVPNPDYANNANKKPVKSINALDQNSVSLFGAPMETMKNKTGKKAAIIKRR